MNYDNGRKSIRLTESNGSSPNQPQGGFGSLSSPQISSAAGGGQPPMPGEPTPPIDFARVHSLLNTGALGGLVPPMGPLPPQPAAQPGAAPTGDPMADLTARLRQLRGMP
jgi:hypothetical protein